MTKALNKTHLLIIEAFAVLFNILYTALYIKESFWCWPFALAGALLFAILCYRKKLLAETVLQVFYVLFAIYGFFGNDGQWEPEEWQWSTHLSFILLGALLTLVSWKGLLRFTKAELPLLDSFTTIFSLVATWVMVNFVHENWIYWMAIDSASIYLYARKKMYLGALLFVLYLLLAINGYWELGWI